MKKLAVRGLLAATFGMGSLLGVSCGEEAPKAVEAEGCVLDSDCGSPLVCAFKLCHAECDPDAGNRDCEDGARCVAESSGGVCLLPEESTCSRNSDCPEGLVCGADGECRGECDADRDCPVGNVCAGGACALEEEVDENGELPGETTEGTTCLYTSECPEGLICRAGKCLKECEADVDCDSPKTCDLDLGRCVGEGNYCGDGVVVAPEACDDGNQANQDSCSNDCVAALCGDGVVQPPTGEFCDDGNTVDDDACSNACEFARCGDGIVQVPEVCDDGNFEDEDGCPNDCNPSNCPDGGVECSGACVNPTVDPQNCRACGIACGADQVCQDSECTCAAGLTACGPACADLQTDVNNCGGCGAVCEIPNATPFCMNGGCAGFCDQGFTDCDDILENGCEIDTQTDEQNCGGCGVSCLTDEICWFGNCQLRTDVLQCGFSDRDMSVVVPAGLNFAQSCTPTPNTLFMMFSRNSQGQYDPVAIRDFVANGGSLFTEYTTTYHVFNAVFGTNVPLTGQLGACRDTAPTVVQFTAGDPFWQGFAFQAIPPEDAGCGVDIAAYPGVTPLAGWDATQVSIGYRDFGEGRFWLTEFDWQDTEIAPADYGYSASLLRQMIVNSMAP